MESIGFVFWELTKALGLALFGLLGVKAVADLTRGASSKRSRYRVVLKSALYLAIGSLVVAGARVLGLDWAAELYMWSSQGDVGRGQYGRAYTNALQAVRLRPGALQYWRTLAVAKLAQRQFESLLDDQLTFQFLDGGTLDEQDAYRFALCYFYLGEYEKALSITKHLIQQNRRYAAPYVLQGMTYSAQKKYADAELTFLDILQRYPTHQAAVEGLAQTYYLAGKRDLAIQLLDETAKHSFPPGARRRFEALKALYAR